MFKQKIRNIQVRYWSNDQLSSVMKRIGHYEAVVNISGWTDSDKEGGLYRDYFPVAKKYDVSNYPGDELKGTVSDQDIRIDLNEKIPEDLVGKYDIGLSHTVLEHLPNPAFSFEQMARLTSDILITIIPWKQVLHFQEGQFGDYFRISPMMMRKFYKDNGFTIIYESYMPEYADDCYLFYIGTKCPDKHCDFERSIPGMSALNGVVGRVTFKGSVESIFLRALYWLYRRLDIQLPKGL